MGGGTGEMMGGTTATALNTVDASDDSEPAEYARNASAAADAAPEEEEKACRRCRRRSVIATAVAAGDLVAEMTSVRLPLPGTPGRG